MTDAVFADDWRECLEAHYMHVVRTEDRVTLPSLTVVMHQSGFNNSELAELRVRATMHVDQVSPDFVPDLEILEETAPPHDTEQGAGVTEAPQVFAVPEMPEVLAAEEAPLEDEPDDEPEAVIEPVVEEPPEEDPDAPQQLSLF